MRFIFRNIACSLLLATGYLLPVSCTDKPKQKPIVINYTKLKEDIIQVNKPAVVMENDEINAYIKAHNYAMKTTGTGLRYLITKENLKGKTIEKGQSVKVNYKISLLDGTICYTSDKKGSKEFIVGADEIEHGIHEGVQLMRVGEKAIFILPAHLGFGLLGDRDKIPPKSAVVYEVEVLSAKVMEKEAIAAYIKTHNYSMQITETGLFYLFTKENPKERKVENGNKLKVNFKVYLFDGTLCYNSIKKGPEQIIVNSNNTESGIQEGVQLMHLHDKAIFILPAHLAFGLIGDRDKIPPKTAVVYEIEVLSIN